MSDGTNYPLPGTPGETESDGHISARLSSANEQIYPATDTNPYIGAGNQPVSTIQTDIASEEEIKSDSTCGGMIANKAATPVIPPILVPGVDKNIYLDKGWRQTDFLTVAKKSFPESIACVDARKLDDPLIYGAPRGSINRPNWTGRLFQVMCITDFFPGVSC